MAIIKILLLVLEVFSSVLLIGIILIQKSKGGGLGGSAFGGTSETIFGARAGNILTRITIILTVIFMTNTLALSFFFAGRNEGSLMDAVPVIEDVRPETAGPVEPVAPAEDPALGMPPVDPAAAPGLPAEEPAPQP